MSRLILISLLSIFSLESQPSFACEANGQGCELDKKQWIEFLSSTLVGAFCKKDSTFLKCYEMDQPQCIKISLEVTDQCVAEIGPSIPQPIPKSDARKWGEKIGSCAGDKLTDRVKPRKGMGDACGNEQPLAPIFGSSEGNKK